MDEDRFDDELAELLGKASAGGDDEDPFVPIWEGPTSEAQHIRLRIEMAHIPVDLGEALLAGQARVEVPRSYLAEVRDVLNGAQASWPEITEVHEDGFDWKPTMRLAFVVMALVLLLLVAFAVF